MTTPTGGAPHRYVVIGAGAIGGTVAGALTRAGVDAVLVARGANARALDEHGLTMRTPDGTFTVPVAVATEPGAVRLTHRDVLVFATKTQQLAEALRQWVDQPVHGPDAGAPDTAGAALPALTALNGISAEEMALRFFARVFGVCVWLPAMHLRPAEVIVRSWPSPGTMHVGRWPAAARTAADDAFLDGVADDWSAAGLRVSLPPDVAPWKVDKLLSNLGNAVGALGAADAASRAVADAVTAAARSEAIAVLDRAGIGYVAASESRDARTHGPFPRPVPGVPDGPANSTWQSLSRATGDVETDYLNGEIVRIAHRFGGTAPINAALSRAARDSVRTGRGPGELTGDRLAALAGLS